MTSLLIIDDSMFQRNFIKMLTQQRGYTILEAASAVDAFDILAQQTPDCILLDLVMPEMNGLDFLQQLRESGSTIPVIVVTADIQKSVRQRCMELGAIEVLYKPVDDSRLLAAIDRAV